MSMTLSRRTFLCRITAATMAAMSLLGTRRAVGTQTGMRYPERVARLLRESTAIDMLDQFLYRTDKEGTLSDWLSKPNAFKSSDFRLFTRLRRYRYQLWIGGEFTAGSDRAVWTLEQFLFSSILSGCDAWTKRLTLPSVRLPVASESFSACNPAHSSKT